MSESNFIFVSKADTLKALSIYPDLHIPGIFSFTVEEWRNGRSNVLSSAKASFPSGDDLRWALDTAADGFDLASRKNLARSYARIAFLLAKQGVTVIVATISLFHDIHAWNRANLPGYFEVFLAVRAANTRH